MPITNNNNDTNLGSPDTKWKDLHVSSSVLMTHSASGAALVPPSAEINMTASSSLENNVQRQTIDSQVAPTEKEMRHTVLRFSPYGTPYHGWRSEIGDGTDKSYTEDGDTYTFTTSSSYTSGVSHIHFLKYGTLYSLETEYDEYGLLRQVVLGNIKYSDIVFVKAMFFDRYNKKAIPDGYRHQSKCRKFEQYYGSQVTYGTRIIHGRGFCLVMSENSSGQLVIKFQTYPTTLSIEKPTANGVPFSSGFKLQTENHASTHDHGVRPAWYPSLDIHKQALRAKHSGPGSGREDYAYIDTKLLIGHYVDTSSKIEDITDEIV